jgi:nucleotide-binding universal stress UspA family protein
MKKPLMIAHAAQEADPNEPGFVHAVALAVQGGARLTSVHACAAGAPELDLPPARTLLSRWGLTEDRAPHARVQHSCCDSVDETLLDALARIEPDLLVVGTHARGGIARFLFGSVAEGVARNLRAPTLLLPLDGPQLADARTGALRLARMLLPVSDARDAQAAVDASVAFARLARVETAELVLLHVEDGSPSPDPQVPSGFAVQRRAAAGPIDRAIAHAARDLEPDLVVMVTHGHDAATDVLLASHTERALHACRRPLLWVPANRPAPLTLLAAVGSNHRVEGT